MPLKALGITEAVVSKSDLYLTDNTAKTTQNPLNSKLQIYFLVPIGIILNSLVLVPLQMTCLELHSEHLNIRRS